MCGISGIISPNAEKVSARTLKQMNDALRHRGPDGEGYYEDHSGQHHTGLAHRRLSIIDLTDASAQPLHYLDRYVLVYNGEIYNYKELRQSLISKGYHFISSGDSEVVAATYACYGENCMDMFDGMFAFAIWDEQEKILFSARDRFGEKPFHYYYDHATQEFYFASEIKALLAAGISREVNHQLLYDFITIGYTKNVSHPEHTFYKHVLQLPPSHYLRFIPSKNELETGRYWDLDKESAIEMYEDQAIEKFQELLQTSINQRLRSDVAIGTSLSGGLDSSSIIALASGSKDSRYTHKAFSAIFPGFEKDESKLIRKIAGQFSLDLFTVTPSADDLAARMKELVYHQDEPFGSASVFVQYEVYRMAKKEGVKVLLDGQGADETLAGYKKYTHWYLQEKIQTDGWKTTSEEAAILRNNQFLTDWSWRNRLAALMPALASAQLKNKAIQVRANNPYIDHDYAKANADQDSIHKPVVEKLNDIQYFDTMVMGLDDLLRYADRNSMAHGREVRLPFLSHQLVQFIFSLPASFRIRDGYTKWILRKSMNDKLPAEICWQKGKTGFEPPQREWLQYPTVKQNIRNARKKLIEERICNETLLDSPLQPAAAHEENNFDWRCWIAATFIS
jgi:asparagine synthase (glutamine-hydrolysing)